MARTIRKHTDSKKPLFVRWVYAIIISASSIVLTCTSSIYSMAMTRVGEQFHRIATGYLHRYLLFFYLAWAGDPSSLPQFRSFMAAGSFYIFSFLFMIPFQLMTGFANNMATLLIGRFFARLLWLRISGSHIAPFRICSTRK